MKQKTNTSLATQYHAFQKAHELLPGREVDYLFVKAVMEEFTIADAKIASFIQKHGAGTEPKYGKKLVKLVQKEPEYQDKRRAYLHGFYPHNPENIMRL